MAPKRTDKNLQFEIASRLLLLRVRLFSNNASRMAKSMNLTPQIWYNYESGRRSLDATTATLLVEVHGVDFNWLYAGRKFSAKPWTLKKLNAPDAPPAKPARRKQRTPRPKATPEAGSKL